MVTDKHTSSYDRLERFSQALAETRRMQDEWLTHGIDFVQLYVEDVEGDWLERWNEDEQTLLSDAPIGQAVATVQPLGGSVVESLTAFLESDDPIAVRVRERLGARINVAGCSPVELWGRESLSEIAAKLEHLYCSFSQEEDRLCALKKLLDGGVFGGGINRNFSHEDKDSIELLGLADSLLKKLAEIWGKVAEFSKSE